MVEVLVRREGRSLFTVEEWTGHSSADWTLGKGDVVRRLGKRFAGKVVLLPLVTSRLRLEEVEKACSQGARTPEQIATVLRRSAAEVLSSLATLRRLGRVPRF